MMSKAMEMNHYWQLKARGEKSCRRHEHVIIHRRMKCRVSGINNLDLGFMIWPFTKIRQAEGGTRVVNIILVYPARLHE